jgi:hypothetical protein
MKTKSGRKRWLKEPTRCDALGRVPYQTEAEAKAAREVAGQKRMDEATARGYIRTHPNWKSRTSASQPLGQGEKSANPTQSDPIIPPAMEAEVARLNRGDSPTLRFGAARGDENQQGNGTNGTNGAAEGDREDRPDWDPEDELILKEAAEAHQRREAARKAEEEKKAEEEYRLWRVDFGFEEPTEEDIALGRTKRKRWNTNSQETSNSQQPTPNIQADKK